MRRSAFYYLLLLASLLFLTNCVPEELIRSEFTECLVQMNGLAIDEANIELQIIDKRICATEEKLMKLEQVVAPSIEWVESQKVKLLGEFASGSWSTWVTQAGLREFKNDCYEVTALELSVYEIGTPNQRFSAIIRVRDLETGAQGDWQELKNELEAEKAALESWRQQEIEHAKLSASIMQSVLEHLAEWKIQRIDSYTYIISGYGLGLAEELTDGKWVYLRDARKITPVNAHSMELREVLVGKF